MKKSTFTTLLMLPVMVSTMKASEIYPQAPLILDVLTSHEQEGLKLKRYERGYALALDDQEHAIPTYMVSKPLREMNPEQLAAFLKSNYLTLKQCSDGEISLEDHGRLPGGGWGGAWTFGVGGKVVSQCTVFFIGYGGLLITKKIIGARSGPAAEQAFEQRMHSSMLPHLESVANKIGNTTGAVGTVIGGIFFPV